MDLFIRNATIVDGSGDPPYRGSVGTAGDKIVFVTREEVDPAARELIDGSGLCLTPGFIDCHSHGDQAIGQEPAMLAKISQGITTEIAGQCGGSIFPVNPEHLKAFKDLMAIGTHTFPDDLENWTSFRKFARFAGNTPLAVNMKTFTGHSSLRIAAMGMREGKPSAGEMEAMKEMLRESMEYGSMGLSSGLIYAPGCYADLDELTELASVAAKYGGLYATHMRNESDHILKAVREALEVGLRAGLPVCISHHKICGRQNWGLSQGTLSLIRQAESRGLEVTIDHYPYTANYTNMNVCIPPHYYEDEGMAGMLRALEDPDKRLKIRQEMPEPGTYDNFYLNSGGFDGMFICSSPREKDAEGLLVSQYAEKLGKDGFDTFFDLLLVNRGQLNGVFHSICEEDNAQIILDKNTVIGTDGNCRSLDEPTHPRTFGSFPRAIRHYVFEQKLMPLETMVRKVTGLAAKRMRLPGKGRIREGYDADLVLFSPEKIGDKADYLHSTRLSQGIERVIVNGVTGYRAGKMTRARAGRFIRHQG